MCLNSNQRQLVSDELKWPIDILSTLDAKFMGSESAKICRIFTDMYQLLIETNLWIN
jgi:hypothetical protein